MLIRLTCAGNFARPFWRPIENCLFGIIHIWVVFWLIEFERWTVFEQMCQTVPCGLKGERTMQTNPSIVFVFVVFYLPNIILNPKKIDCSEVLISQLFMCFGRGILWGQESKKGERKKKEKKLHWLQNYTLPCMVVSVNHLKII
jgi:hypothetical protein